MQLQIVPRIFLYIYMNRVLFRSSILCTLILYSCLAIVFSEVIFEIPLSGEIGTPSSVEKYSSQSFLVAFIILTGTITSLLNHGTSGPLWKYTDRVTMLLLASVCMYLSFQFSIPSSVRFGLISGILLASSLVLSNVFGGTRPEYKNQVHLMAHIISTITLCYFIILVAQGTGSSR